MKLFHVLFSFVSVCFFCTLLALFREGITRPSTTFPLKHPTHAISHNSTTFSQINQTKAIATADYIATSHNSSNESKELDEWRRKRVKKEIYDNFFVNHDGKGLLLSNADRSGPILDFAIVGFPKCGTTGMMRTLSAVTTMPQASDVCTPVSNVAYYSYINWANSYGKGAYQFDEEKPLKGTKCPQWLESVLPMLGDMVPKTNLIAGIRHPVMFFQSFLNQLRHSSTKSVSLEDYINQKLLKKNNPDNHGCINKQLLCVARSRFYISLANLGKTMLGPEEYELLVSELYQSKRRMNDTSKILKKNLIPKNNNITGRVGIPNKVFLFDSSQGKKEYLYQELARFINIDYHKLPPIHEVYVSHWSNQTDSKTNKEFVFNICLPKYEYIRKQLLPISYTLGRWLLDYFIPASYHRDDVTIPNVPAFAEIVRSYLQDPCNTLVRNETDGEYYRRSFE